MRQSSQPTPRTHRERRTSGRSQLDPASDPYHPQRQPKGPIVCPQCGVVHAQGRWHWGTAPDGATAELCPACLRIRDRLPAGVVTLHGRFAQPRLDEMLALARHHEAAEKEEHPLNRIMRTEETVDALQITTTDIHLPRRIGEALRRAFHGELDFSFDEDAYFARIDWYPPKG
jgi:hypothetical protein